MASRAPGARWLYPLLNQFRQQVGAPSAGPTVTNTVSPDPDPGRAPHIAASAKWRTPATVTPVASPSAPRHPALDSDRWLPATAGRHAERELHRRTLSRVVGIAGAVAVVLCLVDAALSSTLHPSEWLLALAATCAAAHGLNRSGRYYAACALFVGSALLVTTRIIIMGDGLGDAGIVAIPVIIVAGTILYGKRAAIPLFAVAAAAVVFAALFGDPAVVPGKESLATRLSSVVVILGATAAFMWVVTDDADRYLERLERSRREIDLAYELTLEGWAKILEYRDEETQGHSRRVADLAVALARELGLDEETVLNVRRGALLHDIGKLGVPDHILLKPGPLDVHERTIMQQHPVIAREMLANIGFLRPALSIPYHHHERWDGTGYPEGLAGTDIPLAARLFAIVDQWEALTSDRPYRRAWQPAEALAYLHANSGKIFDPAVVDAFVRVLDRLAAIPRPRRVS